MAPPPIVIYGNGAMARVLHSYARHSVRVAGFTVDGHCIEAGADTFCGLPLVPFDDVQRHFPPADVEMIVAVGFVAMNALREQKSDEAKAKGYRLARYVHPSLIRHDDVEIGENCIIYEHVSIHPGSRIGAGTFITSNVSIGHDCVVEEYNWINGGVSFAGGCRVGRGCFFGVNASIADGLQLGARTFVGAGTLVAKNTGADEVHVAPAGQKLPLSSTAFLNFKRRRP
jgi:sugar O-acyltransferase (sialic acid O-acetyltransferase NeuD family)